ncbi:MAG TPA: phosphatase PAP2 family protein [Conexibacter sp.]|nr:phosphatase PAP2 family protein [Conexibacter sp.]
MTSTRVRPDEPGPAGSPAASPDAAGSAGLATRLSALDLTGLRIARTLGHTPNAERAVRAYSTLGQHGALWLGLGAAGAALDPARRPRWRRATLSIGVAYAVNQAIKLAVRRPRPQLAELPPLIGTPTQLSFPSAHAATSAAAVHAFWHLLPWFPLRGAAFGMTLSRLYLGVHYPSDIVAGVLLGATIGRMGARR